MLIRKIKQTDRTKILDLAKMFYSTDAVSHTVPLKNLEATFDYAVQNTPYLKGYAIENNNTVVGFCYLTYFFSCEKGGKCMMIEEIYFDENSRGKGFGKDLFKFIFDDNKDVLRFRLEVTNSNKKAINFYKKLGFDFLDYMQMYKDM